MEIRAERYGWIIVCPWKKDPFLYVAKLTGLALNIAIGLQVLVGALITGISALVTGHNVCTLFPRGLP